MEPFIVCICLLIVLGCWLRYKCCKENGELKKHFDEKMLGYYHSGTSAEAVLHEVQSLAWGIERNYKILRFLIPGKRQSMLATETRMAIAAFESQLRTLKDLPFSVMMDESNYGKANSSYKEQLVQLNRQEVEYIVLRHENAYQDKGTYTQSVVLDPKEMLRCVWYLAMETPCSVEYLMDAISLYKEVYRTSHNDLLIAEYYAKKQIAGEDILNDPVRKFLSSSSVNQNTNTKQLTIMASALMWMNAYRAERMVLQHILSLGLRMDVKMQQRLHALSMGGDDMPSGFDVKSSHGTLYFDVSTLGWKDDQYVGLFENLAFQDRGLTYSLAVRDENKELFVPRGLSVPNMQMIFSKLQDVFTDEYETDVKLQLVNSIALSGSGEEQMEGILVAAAECEQMNILLHIAKIGKKLIVKFYTLFTPVGTDPASQKQQALSVYKKLSLTVSMWESSLKDTMLMAIEQLLNTTAQGTANSDASGVLDDPIF